MLTNRTIPAFSKKVADLPDTPSSTMTAAQIKAQMDAAPEELRAAHNAAMDDLSSTTPGSSGAEQIGSAPIAGVAGSTPYAQIADVKAQLNAATTGGIPDGSITPAKLSFDPATQAELNAVLNNGAVFTGDVTINRIDPGFMLKAQDSGHENEQIKVSNYWGEFKVQDLGTNGTWAKDLLRIVRSTGEAYLGSNAIAKIQKGTYTGDGTTDRTIAVGFTPKFVFIMAPSKTSGSATVQLMSTGGTVNSNLGNTTIKCVTNGFQIGAYANEIGVAYEWVAFG